MLQVNPCETWLRDDCDGTAFFPQDDGSFDFDSLGVSAYTTLVVEGPALATPVVSSCMSNLPRPSPSATVSATPTSIPPSFRSVTASKRQLSFSLKVVKVTMCRRKNKPEFQPVTQTFIDLVDSIANLEHILSIIQRRWGSEYIIVTNDGLPLEDSPATQGMSICYLMNNTIVTLLLCNHTGMGFWKCPRRKVYAVSNKDLTDSTPHSSWKRPIMVDSDDDNFEPRSKKARKEDKLDMVLDEVQGVKASLVEMMALTQDSKVPMGLKRIIRDTFKCRICHTVPIKPPVIVTKCCKNILGCESCINKWYSGSEALIKPCPAC